MVKLSGRVILLILTMLFPMVVFSMTADQNLIKEKSSKLELTGGLGLTHFMNKPHVIFQITDYVNDALKKSKQHYTPAASLSFKKEFFLDNNHILSAISFGPALYLQKLHFSGEVWEFELPEFNNYHYNFTSQNWTTLLESHIYFHQIAHTLYPFLIAGVGASMADVKYSDHAQENIPVDSELHLGKNRNTNFSYIVGAGVAIPLNKTWAASVGCTYLHLGNGYTAKSKNVNLQEPLKIKLNSSNIYFGLSYFIL